MARSHQKGSVAGAFGRQNTDSVADAIYGRRRRRAEENLAPAREERAAEQLNFRQRQAGEALQHVAVTSLTEGSIARLLADAIIEAFPTADPYTDDDGVKVSRTDAAFELALETLTDEQAESKGAVWRGKTNAGFALRYGYCVMTEQELPEWNPPASKSKSKKRKPKDKKTEATEETTQTEVQLDAPDEPSDNIEVLLDAPDEEPVAAVSG